MTWTLALIGALVFASLMHGLSGIAVGAAIGYLLGRVLGLNADLDALRAELRAQQKVREAGATGDATTEMQAPAHPAAPAQTEPSATPAHDVAMTTARSAATPPPLPPRIPVPAMTAQAPTLGARAIDWLRGGNPLARVGMVILFFGGAFLAKYAAEHSHFSIEMRLSALASGAFILLVLGWLLRGRRAVYAQTLQGGGIAGLYLTVFAATRLYHLLIPGYALGLLVLIGIAAALLAVVQDALTLAVFGTAGGFMAPILLSSGSSWPRPFCRKRCAMVPRS